MSRIRFGITIVGLFLMLEAVLAMSISKISYADEMSPVLSMDSNGVVITEDGWMLPVSLKCPEFVFDGQTVGTELAPVSVTGDIQESCGQALEVLYAPVDLGGSAHLEVKTYLQWSPNDHVLSKWARYRLVGSDTAMLINEIVLERLETPGQTPSVTAGQVYSYPVFMHAFFAGIEFPVAAISSESNHIVLAHRPGLWLQPGRWYETRKAVFGAAPVGEEREAFKRYISNHRPGEKGFHVNYNSWWTLGVPYSESDVTNLMNTFKDNLYTPYNQHFDTFAIDMGWSDPKSFWRIDADLFPKGFAPLQSLAAGAKSSLGLWVSPSNYYSPASMDNEWAKDNGYETFLQGTMRLCCLAGPKYRDGFKGMAVEMASKYGIRHFKFDGYCPQCPESNHGHQPGEYSAEAVADGVISIFQAIHRAASNAWIETTCMGWNPSPWWLFYANSVLGTYGDDSPLGRIPCPVYRESYTTARDYYNLQGAALLSIPITAQEVLGIVHQSSEPFTNDAVTTIMRGNMFVPVYINPKYMNDARWKSFAGIISWARANVPTLRETRPILPASWQNGKVPQFAEDAVMPREPYGYAHCDGVQGLVELRNPWIAGCDYFLKLDSELGLSSQAAGLSVVSLYPEARVYGQNLNFGDTLSVPLASYETVVLSIAPDQSVSGISTAAESLSGFGRVSLTRCEKAYVNYSEAQGAFGPDWTSMVGDAANGVRLLVDADVEVTAPESELLVLVEGSTEVTTPAGHILVNGVEVEPTVSGSSNGWSATVRSAVNHWKFMRVPLTAGQNAISMELYSGSAPQTISAWVWAKKSGNATSLGYPNVLPQPEDISLQSACLVEPFDAVDVTSPVVEVDRPIERIEGIFLDCMEPISVTQGYGTLRLNQSVWEKPMIIAGTEYIRGLGTHAVSRIVYSLGGNYKQFRAYAGADSNTTPTVTFRVNVDGVKKWESGVMTCDDTAESVSVDVTGKQTLELVVGDGGNGIASDHADWAEARLLR